MIGVLLPLLVVPACFVLAGLLGHHLGTVRSLAVSVGAVGACHLVAIGLSAVAVTSPDGPADLAHVASQVVFLGGFVALVWVARAYPLGARPGRLEVVAVLVAFAAPVLGGLAGATPTVFQPSDGGMTLGPLVTLLPEGVAAVAALPLLVLPVLAVVVFGLRFAGAGRAQRRVMVWPLAGVAVVGVLAAAGSVLGSRFPVLGDVVFLTAAPVLPLTLALGPVRRRMLALDDQTSRLSEALAARVAELEESRHRLSVAAEQERRRIERDLHDSAQQELLALIAHVEVARSLSSAEGRDRAMTRVAELARGAYDTVRRISHGIRPAVLDDLGLPGAVRAVIEAFPVPVRLELDGVAGRRFRSEVEGAAHGFLSEALANVLKHARASDVRVGLVTDGHVLRVSVTDDGVGGVDPGGAGIRGLRDRVEAVGGRVTIDTRPGRTCLAATFPGEEA
jgi:signal transduction histidine kinase